jgi:hypothetical protein
MTTFFPAASERGWFAFTLFGPAARSIEIVTVRARLWRAGELGQEEIHNQRLNDYTKNELALMLEIAAFEDIRIYGDFSDAPANADHKNLVFIATK